MSGVYQRTEALGPTDLFYGEAVEVRHYGQHSLWFKDDLLLAEISEVGLGEVELMGSCRRLAKARSIVMDPSSSRMLSRTLWAIHSATSSGNEIPSPSDLERRIAILVSRSGWSISVTSPARGDYESGLVVRRGHVAIGPR